MRKKLLFIVSLFTVILTCKKVYAFDVNNYKYRDLCGNYEVAGFHSDGYIDKVSCFSSFNEAKNFMKNNGAADLAVMTKVNGQTKIVDANKALLDLSVNPETLTYFYENSELTSRQYTYMDTGSLYGGVDGGLLDTSYSNAKGVFTAKVRTGNFTGWISQEAYEIVPITWLKSYSSYTVTNDSIRHNYVTKIQNDYKSSGGSTIGPKPEMLSQGTYYSFDGHYFYKNIESLMVDYKNNNYNNSVNKNNPYYNYYMYLSNHTKTAYSSINIDEYIRNNLGYNKNVYGHKAGEGTSRLYGSGTFFYYAQEKYGVNAILSLSLSRNETGNGRSNLSINKNNGFGLNAVDSNPTQAANWYSTFQSSILGYASKWITYGYAHPRDWRYFGPQFGDKWIGMNVKYASDTYWSEKMASNYYNMDKALGLQDYNYYQLGVLKNPANAYAQASTGSKFIYKYPEAEDAVVIVGETTSNGEKWYKVVSDLNIDSNYNEISSGAYNWNGYVYVQANNIRKINNGKNGYVSPNNVTEYANKNYEYNLYDSGNTFNPKVAISTKDTQYYYDSSLQQRKGQTLLKDRYVMVFAQATLNGRAVSYLVTSDYFHDQKHWVSADSIKFTNTSYGRVTVDTSDNQYTWVNYNTEDKLYSKISGLYTYTYVPVLSSQRVGNDTWYKVPVSLSDNNNVYGYTLASYSNYIRVDLATPIIENTKPVIVAENKTIEEKDSFNPKDKVTAYDNEDGDLTNKIEVVSNKVDTNNPGNYEVVYKVQDSMNEVATKTITVTVKENSAPEIIANDKTIIEGEEFDELKEVTAKDKEDGDLTSKIKVKENTVKETKGTYKVVYEVSDSKGKTTTKEIKVVVEEQSIEEKPKDINPESTKIEEDINDYDIDELLEKQKDGQFNLESLEFNKNTKKFSISGYLIIDGVDNIDKEYALVLVNKNDEDKTYAVNIDSWTKDIPYNLGTVDGHNYEDIWFKGNIDFTDIPNGDYDLYMLGANENSFTIQLVDNFFGVDISKRGEDANHGYNFKVRSDLRTQQIELNIRDELYTTSVSPTYRDMVNEFDTILFKNNKLYLKGYSYNYGGTYKEQLNITRKLLLENTSTYKQEVFELGSSKGLFDIKTKDNKDKTYAWYENEIDLSKLEKGVYSLQVYTKTIDAEDYGEITDMFEELNEKATIGDKNFIITYNKNKQDRIELTIK
jgi:beta-N-acetylglucosaminidase